jgi:glucose-6-phosphate isomerase
MIHVRRITRQGGSIEDRVMIEIHFANMMEDVIGEKGISIGQIEGLRDKIAEAHKQIRDRKWRELAFLDLVDQDTARIKKLAVRVKETSEDFLLLGIGGSATGPRAIVDALKPMHNYLSSPRIFIYDNSDPRTLNSLLSVLDLPKTTVNVVTKSGSTAETISSFMILWDRMQRAVGKDAPGRFIITTDPHKGFLRKIAGDYGIETLAIPSGVVGRHSVLSPAGLLLSEVAGIDSDELLRGAADIIARCANAELWENPAYVLAALLYLMKSAEGRGINVIMPYADGFDSLSHWCCQLWAESLAKLGCGLTPYPSVGTKDQHSQLQLWMEGPEDKVVLFIRIDDYGSDIVIPRVFTEVKELDYLAESTLSELMQTAMSSTETVMAGESKPNLTLSIPTVDAYHVGQLFQFLEITTTVIGFLFGINPFNQPWIDTEKDNILTMIGKPVTEKALRKTGAARQPNICWKI